MKRSRLMKKYPSASKLSRKRLVDLSNKLFSEIVRSSSPEVSVKVTRLVDYQHELLRRSV